MKNFMKRDKEINIEISNQLESNSNQYFNTQPVQFPITNNPYELCMSNIISTEDDILTDVSTRNRMLNNDFVMTKVKNIMTLSHLNYCNVKMVAEYFEVPEDTINTVIKRNRDELLQNGMKILSGSDIKNMINSVYEYMEPLVEFEMNTTKITNMKGYFIYNNQRFANNSNTLLNKRSILNIAMLLRDSIIAQRIRKELLDIEENQNNKNVEQEQHDYNNYNNKRLYDEIIENRKQIKEISLAQTYLDYLFSINKLDISDYEKYKSNYNK